MTEIGIGLALLALLAGLIVALVKSAKAGARSKSDAKTSKASADAAIAVGKRSPPAKDKDELKRRSADRALRRAARRKRRGW